MRMLVLAVAAVCGIHSTVSAATFADPNNPTYTGSGADIFVDPVLGFASVFGPLESFTNDGMSETAVTDFDITGLIDPTLGGGDAVLTVFESATSVTAGSDIFLEGDLIASTPFGSTSELLFAVTGGEAAPLYGDNALVAITNVIFTTDAVTSDILGTGDVAISSIAQPIPVPASLWLLASALFAFGIASSGRSSI